MALTDKEIKALKPEEKTYTISDGGGLSIEVSPKGGKWWRFRYRFDNKAKKASLGVYPDVSLSKARMRRDKARIIIADGLDPYPVKSKRESNTQNGEMSEDEWKLMLHQYEKLRTKQRKEATESNGNKISKLETELFTAKATFKQWTEFYKIEVYGDVTVAHIERSVKGWKKDVYPVIGDMPMNDIGAKHITSIVRTMNTRGVKESAKKVFSSISRVFQVSMAHFPDEIERNPTKDISLKDILGKKVVKHYPIITDAKQLGILLTAIDGYEGHSSTRLALKMIAHTFVRPFNIRHMEWSEVDLNGKQWVIPSSKMKTNKELIVPLSSQAIEILTEAKGLSGSSKLVFPAPKSINDALSDASMVGALRRLGYTKDEIVAHSFRGIFSTIAHEDATYSHEVIETQLAHSVGSNVSQAYNRAKYLPERTQMMQWYSDLLEGYQNDV